MDSDADRLALIKGLGGQLVRHDSGQFWAIFDNGFSAVDVGDTEVEAASPSLTARTSDVESLSKETPLTFRDFAGREVTYVFTRHEPDGSGLSRILLRG